VCTRIEAVIVGPEKRLCMDFFYANIYHSMINKQL